MDVECDRGVLFVVASNYDALIPSRWHINAISGNEKRLKPSCSVHFVGFGVEAVRFIGEFIETRIGIPFWFPTTISAALLRLVWRKTRPPAKGRAFPVEAVEKVANGSGINGTKTTGRPPRNWRNFFCQDHFRALAQKKRPPPMMLLLKRQHRKEAMDGRYHRRGVVPAQGRCAAIPGRVFRGPGGVGTGAGVAEHAAGGSSIGGALCPADSRGQPLHAGTGAAGRVDVHARGLCTARCPRRSTCARSNAR